MKKESLELLPRESWWGGLSDAGTQMPFRPGAKYDLRGENFLNQTAPFLISSAGRFVWSEEPFRFSFSETTLSLEGTGPFVVGKKGKTLPEAFAEASRRFFPAKGKLPHPLLFTAPQYNTWIELMYDQAQDAILKYARNLLKKGYPPGVLMIDCGWANYYGDWDFNPTRFHDPKKMMRELHALGFQVMLWVIPFVTPDSVVYRQLRYTPVLIKDAQGKPVIREWWDGYSAVVDLTGGEGLTWFLKQLARLRKEYGVDGFKIDGGDTPYYRDEDVVAVPTTSNGQTEAFARVGLNFRLNEFRACWKCAGEPLVHRLRDKYHTWDDTGLRSLIPNTLAQGLMGYPFVCPDMIGGGEYVNFMANAKNLDAELFVRYAQASALLPMMQFSAASWRVLDRYHHQLCVEAARLHLAFGQKILALAKQSAKTGEPIARHLTYQYPDQGYEKVTDQFMLGPNILVAPVLEKGAKTRTVHLPPGSWKADDGTKFSGGGTIEVPAPLERLPYFIKQ